MANGLEPLTDGGWPLDRRRSSGGVADDGGADRSIGQGGDRRSDHERPARGGPPARDGATSRTPAAGGSRSTSRPRRPIGDDADARARFADAHRALTDGLEGVHLSLAVIGGNADAAGIETILAGAYSSLALDLIDGPDNWRLATAAPGEVGLICGALSTRAGSDDGPEMLLWAAGYAASTRGRGPARVGLATAGSLAALPWEVAARKVERLGHAARLASLPEDDRQAAIDPRAVDARSAALGRYEPPASRRSMKSRKSSSPGD